MCITQGTLLVGNKMDVLGSRNIRIENEKTIEILLLRSLIAVAMK